MLVSWEIWNEQNARVFRMVSSMPNVITSRIKAEVGVGRGQTAEFSYATRVGLSVSGVYGRSVM